MAGVLQAMKSLTQYLTFNIPSKMAFVNITAQVEEAVRKSGVVEGLVLCNSMHITSSVFINDDEAVASRLGRWLNSSPRSIPIPIITITIAPGRTMPMPI